MNERCVYGSVTRVADLAGRPRERRRVPRSEWATGDFVVGVVREDAPARAEIEAPNGRTIDVVPGDLVVGALGVRAATLEAVGHWRAVGPDLVLHALTSAGVLGRCTSRAVTLRPLVPLVYAGHVFVAGRRARMGDWVVRPAHEPAPFRIPTVLLVGTSMDAGKTVSGQAIVRCLKRQGLRVAGAKLSGVGRLRDILALEDAGADVVFDFVDAGLPSTVCPEAEFEDALGLLLATIADTGADVLVAEAGASPLEPYNGAAVVRALEPFLRMVVLCASDPYAVVGVQSAFGLRPDLVAGRAASTAAAVELVEALSGVPALNLLDSRSHGRLDVLLADALRPERRAGAATGGANPARVAASAP